LRPPPRAIRRESPYPYTAPMRSVRRVVDEATDGLDPTGGRIHATVMVAGTTSGDVGGASRES
jgi:hypothetical protein